MNECLLPMVVNDLRTDSWWQLYSINSKNYIKNGPIFIW